jgi:DNA replication protein DnaC
MEISQLMSEVRKNLKNPTRSDGCVPKLPPALQDLTSEELESAIVSALEIHVEARGLSFHAIPGTEMEAKIHSAINWLIGPQRRSCLLLQGRPGTGKTSLLYAMYSIYNAANASIASTSGIALHEAFVLQTAGASCAYEEYRRIPRLCIDDLGAEPCRCMIYGVEYTPIQTLLSYRYAKQLPTILTTNLSDAMIHERYGERISDRFSEMCTILRFSGTSYRK